MFGLSREDLPPVIISKSYRTLTEAGVLIFSRPAEFLTPAETQTSKALVSPELAGFLAQAEDEGFAIPVPQGKLISWPQLYRLLDHPDYASSLLIIELPPTASVCPILKSHNSIADANFTITVSGWHNGSGEPALVLGVIGGTVQTEQGHKLLSQNAWAMLDLIGEFHRREDHNRTEAFHRRMWGLIRRLALQANARLDDFLYKSVVLTPEKLDIGMRRADVGGIKVVEVTPTFQDAPGKWIETFDKYRTVPDRYDIPTAEGIVQVLITPQVKTVLRQIKHFDNRRVAGIRAEAFVTNPFATLGDDASDVIDAEQFEQARADAGLAFERFTAHIVLDAIGYPEEVGVLIQSARGGGEPSQDGVSLFRDNVELEAFITSVQLNLDRGLQLCRWRGYELELLGDTRSELEMLSKALHEREKPRVLVGYLDVYDLTHYSSRVEAIGVEKPYYSLYIAKRKNDEGWFPENIISVISFLPDGEVEPAAIPITGQVRGQLEARLGVAKEAGEADFELRGFPKPITVREAEAILASLDEVLLDVCQGKFDPSKPKKNNPPRKALVIKANIQNVDYQETRRDILNAYSNKPKIPASLREDSRLKDHQSQGVARLQHLFKHSPEHCRGVLLADDMGLGKTLQLLTLIAWAFEQYPKLEPALVVAPVSLLENWDEEAKKFFKPGALPILTVYGDSLKAMRVSPANIEEQLKSDGLVKFLKPGWRGDAHLVLTTYETLRDLEFSFAAECWSIMVCDEAQKIKNPNAMVTRSAKKQNVRFKVACTGTPVENTLADLWSLFDFVQPGLLGALNEFGKRYRMPIEAKTDEEKARVEELRGKIEPQVIRRTKKEVAKDLPEKKEFPCDILLSNHQRSLYVHSIELFKKRNDAGAIVPFKNHLGLLHYLRLICTDPRAHGVDVLKPEPLREYSAKAPKMPWLLDTLQEIKRRGEKAIIFCEFRTIQRLLRNYVEEVFRFSPDIINGDTTASATATDSRQKRIKTFQIQPGFGVIILSPIAVGFGVNIQGANHVIHYMRTWNPAKEDQATDRAYRIGQDKDVFVYYPVTRADDFKTFDVKLHELLAYKRTLAEDMLNGSGDIAAADFTLDGDI